MANDFNKAAERARARELARKNGGAEVTELDDDDSSKALAIQGVDPMSVMAIGPEVIAAKLKSGEWTAQPQIMKLQRGVSVLAFLEGRGPDAEVNDPREGKKLVGTWILRSLDNAGIRVSILTSAQLDRKLPPYIGDADGVSITRLEEHDTATGGRVTDYLVAGNTRCVTKQLAEASVERNAKPVSAA